MARFQFGKRMRTDDATAIRAALQRPVVEDSELAIGRRMNVEFDHRGTGLESRPQPTAARASQQS